MADSRAGKIGEPAFFFNMTKKCAVIKGQRVHTKRFIAECLLKNHLSGSEQSGIGRGGSSVVMHFIFSTVSSRPDMVQL